MLDASKWAGGALSKDEQEVLQARAADFIDKAQANLEGDGHTPESLDIVFVVLNAAVVGATESLGK